MAYIYMRPTADIYVNHTMYPEGSTNGYTLINEEVSDGSATYIGVTTDTADTRVTKTSSFVLAGVAIPLDEYKITGLRLVVRCSVPSSGTNEFLSSYAVTANGVVGISDVCKPAVTGSLLGTTYSDRMDITSFDRNGQLLQTFVEYAKANGRTPDVELAVTTHCTSSKSSSKFYITQLYLEVEYDTLVYKKLPSTMSHLYGGWTQAKVYKKTNGVWSAVRNGRSQVGMQLNKIGHELVAIPYKSPTCTETGLTAGSKCSCCDIVYKEQELIAAKGHTPSTVEASEATCGKDGYTGGQKCSVCNAVISGSVIPATGNHTPVDVAATSPTCNYAGYTAGIQCSVCKTYLSGHDVIFIDPNAHSFVDTAASEATCGADGYTGGQKCSACGYIATGSVIPATGNHTYVDKGDGVAATKIDMGLTSRTICSVCGHVLVDYTTIPMLGHTCTPVTIPAVAANCTYTGLTEGKKCSVCGKILVAQNVVPTNGQHSPVTVAGKAENCGYSGLTAGQKCSICGTTLVAQNVIPATGNHNYVTSNIQSHTVCATCGHIKDFGFANLVYQGTATSLSSNMTWAAATTVGSYAILAGGTDCTAANAYGSSLTRSIISNLSGSDRERTGATTVGNYAIFGGDYNEVYVDAYNASLTHTTASNFVAARYDLGATTVGNYAIFAGGSGTDNTRGYDYVDVYDSSLTHTLTYLSDARRFITATTVGNYAIVDGNSVDAFSSSLTRTSCSSGSEHRAATTVGNYALFGGNNITNDDAYKVDTYNTSLTLGSAPNLIYKKNCFGATTVGNYALFSVVEESSTVDVYNQSLTHTTAGSSGGRDYVTAATTVGNYALFGGGKGSSAVDVYRLQSI